MKLYLSAIVPAFCVSVALAAAPEVRNHEPSAVEAAATAPSTAEVQQALLETRQMLREQAEAMRSMREQIEHQQKELDELRAERAPRPAAETSVSAEDAAHLQQAALLLRAPAAVTQQAAQTPPHRPASGDLSFRIGNASFTPNGWVDFTAYYRSTNVGSGLGTNFQSIPYNNTVQGGQSEVRLSAQSSRIGIRVDEVVRGIKAYGYLEADFNGYLPGNGYVSTNGNSLRMRVYYLNLARGKWEVLGGQGWSLLTPTRKALSPSLADIFNTFHLDTSYQAGLVFARQTQFRFVYHPTSAIALGASVENPEQYSGSAATFPALFNTAQTDINSSSGSGGATATPNVHPDVIAKATFDRTAFGRSWHAGVAGLLTSTRVATPASVTKAASVTDEREGGAGIVNVSLGIFKGFQLISLGYWSDGGGRYLGGTGPGFVVLQHGTATAPFSTALIHSGSGLGGFEWQLSKRTIVSSYYSAAYFQRRYALDPSIKAPTYVGYGYPGSPNSQNRSIQEFSFASNTTLWKEPSYGALQVITQSSYVERSPWYVAPSSPKDAHTFMEFMNLRYVLP